MHDHGIYCKLHVCYWTVCLYLWTAENMLMVKQVTCEKGTRTYLSHFYVKVKWNLHGDQTNLLLTLNKRTNHYHCIYCIPYCTVCLYLLNGVCLHTKYRDLPCNEYICESFYTCEKCEHYPIHHPFYLQQQKNKMHFREYYANICLNRL